MAALPIGLCSYALIHWGIRRGYFDAEGAGSEQAVPLNHAIKHARRQRKKRKTNPLHDKWFQFGGGFYGIVALLTYAVIETKEIYDFFAAYASWVDMLANISIGSLVGLIIASIMNFVAAITWPVYWLSEIHTEHVYIWMIAAYFGYWLGMRMAEIKATASHQPRPPD